MSEADRLATSFPPSVRPRLLLWSRAMKPNTSSAGIEAGTARGYQQHHTSWQVTSWQVHGSPPHSHATLLAVASS